MEPSLLNAAPICGHSNVSEVIPKPKPVKSLSQDELTAMKHLNLLKQEDQTYFLEYRSGPTSNNGMRRGYLHIEGTRLCSELLKVCLVNSPNVSPENLHISTQEIDNKLIVIISIANEKKKSCFTLAFHFAQQTYVVVIQAKPANRIPGLHVIKSEDIFQPLGQPDQAAAPLAAVPFVFHDAHVPPSSMVAVQPLAVNNSKKRATQPRPAPSNKKQKKIPVAPTNQVPEKQCFYYEFEEFELFLSEEHQALIDSYASDNSLYNQSFDQTAESCELSMDELTRQC
eukprot:TRINITY_DN5278_c0_g1_i1.p1 TRINITY_DN5278_c0_g1~~TRINITY_DN5278_c0_g1_i1.p1  ORF type:complete len:284 (+),score=48.74 TRINITY_DN5278_c0_g1_i1:175-1026(+)